MFHIEKKSKMQSQSKYRGFSALQSIIGQKTELFRTTSVRISSSKVMFKFLNKCSIKWYWCDYLAELWQWLTLRNHYGIKWLSHLPMHLQQQHKTNEISYLEVKFNSLARCYLLNFLGNIFLCCSFHINIIAFWSSIMAGNCFTETLLVIRIYTFT